MSTRPHIANGGLTCIHCDLPLRAWRAGDECAGMVTQASDAFDSVAKSILQQLRAKGLLRAGSVDSSVLMTVKIELAMRAISRELSAAEAQYIERRERKRLRSGTD